VPQPHPPDRRDGPGRRRGHDRGRGDGRAGGRYQGRAGQGDGDQERHRGRGRAGAAPGEIEVAIEAAAVAGIPAGQAALPFPGGIELLPGQCGDDAELAAPAASPVVIPRGQGELF